MSPMNIDSDREEGEIIDDLDELSDISSEEEYLLRQRLEVLENYNNVLERKEAKKSTNQRDYQKLSSKKLKNSNNNVLWCDISGITATECSDRNFSSKDHKQKKVAKKPKPLKHSNEQNSKRRKLHSEVCTEVISIPKHKDHKKKHFKIKAKKKDSLKLPSDSSDETDYEYRNKRRRLANAVNVHGPKTDSSLTDRIKKMLSKPESHDQDDLQNMHTDKITTVLVNNTVSQEVVTKESTEPNKNTLFENEKNDFYDNKEVVNEVKEINNLCVDIANVQVIKDVEEKSVLDVKNDLDCKDSVNGKTSLEGQDSVDGKPVLSKCIIQPDTSDDDLELLRQNALQTKLSKTQSAPPVPQSEDEDSDTAELRLICLKSALLKKAIEMKQKQRLRKRLSQSSNIEDPLFTELCQQNPDKCFSGNNTDIESVDMDIGVSDGPDDDKRKDLTDNMISLDNRTEDKKMAGDNLNVMKLVKPNEEEVDEDEDLLRAKLLISLSKTLPKLINDSITSKSLNVEAPVNTSELPNAPKESMPVEKRFIINTGDSDSGSDNEATKNLTKMHMKLSEQIDFQKKLDIFLKSTRLEVEKKSLPDLIQQPESIRSTKFIPKAVNHLPKSEQLEYNNLVKRMAELEKIKKSRQAAMNSLNSKDTLKPRNVTIDTTIKNNTVQNLDEEISLSRKKIADESAKVLRLKEEGIKLSQKFKIVATELRNIRTALTLNKREQRSANITLSKTRAQHQMLLKRSKMALRSKMNVHFNNISNNKLMVSRLQKENEPLKADIKNLQVLKSVKVNFINDLQEDKPVPEGFSISVNVSNNKRLVKVPKEDSCKDSEHSRKEMKDSVTVGQVDNHVINYIQNRNQNSEDLLPQAVRPEEMEKYRGKIIVNDLVKKNEAEDYRSPLQAFGSWNEDPYAVLCRFEIGGKCKDPDCKYLHPKPPTKH